MTEKRKNRDIQNIFIVLGAAVFCATLLAFFFLYYYGPSGRYLAGNTLLDSSTMNQIHYQNQQSRLGKKEHFIFDRIQFSFFDSQQGQMHTFPLSLETYQSFYKLVSSEKSLLELNQNVQNLFLRSHPALLTISIRPQERTEKGEIEQIFQVVQFVPEDYFRVQLHEKNEGEWAYFYRPGLYQEITRLFTKKVQLKKNNHFSCSLK